MTTRKDNRRASDSRDMLEYLIVAREAKDIPTAIQALRLVSRIASRGINRLRKEGKEEYFTNIFK